MTASPDLDLLLDTVEQLAANAEQRLFRVEAPDGDLGTIDGLLADAATIGLLADPDSDTGRWGVWGRHVDTEGLGLSLAVLRRLGRVCAGLATAVHAQGLGTLLLGPGGRPAGAREGGRLIAAFSPPFGTALDPRTFGDGLHLVERNGLRLQGTARFALVAGTADLVVLAVRAGPGPDAGWAVLALLAGTTGLKLTPTGARIGLRATGMVDVIADRVTIGPEALRHRGERAEQLLCTTMGCDWLGQAAITLGSAERAVDDAAAYAASRVQGGVPIAEHAAIRLLLGRAEHDLAVLAALLDRHVGTPLADLDPLTLLRWGVDARLAAGEHGGRAVTDALQTLGGYGYMDEYGLSKRLRDVAALRVLHGGPDQLLLLRHSLDAAVATP
ncbi:MAG: acyl-CoA dehydrogenase family protein [Acidimicrobiales bacterium]